MKSCHAVNRNFLYVCAPMRVCAQAGACTQTHAHSYLRYRSSGKGLFPYVSSKGEQKQGERTVLSHSHAVLCRSNLKDKQHQQQSPIFPQVLSALSPHLQGTVGAQGWATPVFARLWWQCHRLQRGRMVSSEPGTWWGDFKKGARDSIRIYWYCSAELLTSQPCSRPGFVSLSRLPTSSKFAEQF